MFQKKKEIKNKCTLPKKLSLHQNDKYYNNYIVVHLVTLINEFWFVTQNNKKKEFIKKI